MKHVSNIKYSVPWQAVIQTYALPQYIHLNFIAETAPGEKKAIQNLWEGHLSDLRFVVFCLNCTATKKLKQLKKYTH